MQIKGTLGETLQGRVEIPLLPESRKEKLKGKDIYPDSDEVYNLLIKYHWEDKHAKHLLKRFNKYFR